MKKTILILLLSLGFTVSGYSQKTHKINAEVARLLNNGWHKFTIKGTYYDVEIKEHILVKGNIK